MREHGTRTKYVHDGCRCLPCRAANADYAASNSRARQQGRIDLIDARPARNHLKVLSECGMGWKSVADAAGVSRGTVAKLLGYGHEPSRRIRSTTARSILAVRAHPADGALVDATPTWGRINDLVTWGHPRYEIARYLTGNPQATGLQIGRERVTQGTAAKVERLWEAARAHHRKEAS